MEESERFAVEFDQSDDLVLGLRDDDDMEVDFGEVTDGRTDDFNRLYNRPKFNGEPMTGDTNIVLPELARVAYTGDYDDLEAGIPAVNGVELKGDKSLEDLDVYALTNSEIEDMLDND